jgi:hypothetical protein
MKPSESVNPRVLVLSGVVPGPGGPGDILLSQCCEVLRPAELVFFAASRPEHLTRSRQCPQVADCGVRRFETGYRPLQGIRGEMIGAAAFRALFPSHVSRLADQVVECAGQQRIESLWAVLDNPTTIWMAQQVAERLDVRLALLVMDAPELLIQKLNWDRWSAATLMKRFERTVRSAACCGVSGESMQEQYEQRYGADCRILRMAISPEMICHGEPAPASHGDLIIGFAGSMTVPDAFGSLIKTLDEHGWQLGGRNIRLRMVGCRYLLESSHPQWIEYFGYRSMQDTIALMSECDVTYLPQPFAEQQRPLAELSFPNKLITYLAATRPVLLHAPEHGSLVPFYRRYPYGVWCDSLEPSRVFADLRRLVEDRQLWQHGVRQGQLAIEDEFNDTVLGRNCRELLGLVHSGVEESACQNP